MAKCMIKIPTILLLQNEEGSTSRTGYDGKFCFLLNLIFCTVKACVGL